MHTFKTFLKLISTNIKKNMIYRANFMVTLLGVSLWMTMYVLFFEVLFGHVDSIAGWQKGEVFVFLAFYYIVQGLASTFYKEGFEVFDRKLIRGELDPLLTKPVPSQMLFFFSNVRIDHVLDVLLAFFIFAYASLTTDLSLTLGNLALSSVHLIASTVLFYHLMLCMILPVFIFERIEVISSTFWNVSQITRYPRQIFTGAGRVVVQFIFPIALLGAIPAEIALGKAEPIWSLLLFALTFIFILIGNASYKYGLSLYNSAN